MGILYLVATPIGNLEDITLRALRVLAESRLIAAEDTRTARHLLTHFKIAGRLLSYTEHNRRIRIPQLLAALDEGDVALISEAGTPAVSDPGQELVSAAIAAGHVVRPVPGASAVLAALTAAGLSTRQFVYVGFLPRQPSDRRALIASLAAEPRTIVCFEAPSRLRRSLVDLLAGLGNRTVALCRELTKIHEEIRRLRLAEAVDLEQEPRGEYTLVIEGAASTAPASVDDDARAELGRLRREGLGAREATSRLALELGLPRRQLYEAWLAMEPESEDPDDPVLE